MAEKFPKNTYTISRLITRTDQNIPRPVREFNVQITTCDDEPVTVDMMEVAADYLVRCSKDFQPKPWWGDDNAR